MTFTRLTFTINDTDNNKLNCYPQHRALNVIMVSVVMLSVAFSYCYAESLYAECNYPEYHYQNVMLPFSCTSLLFLLSPKHILNTILNVS
jgi:hypothetical protein